MLMTGEQYIESLRKLNTRVYMFGKKIENPDYHFYDRFRSLPAAFCQ